MTDRSLFIVNVNDTVPGHGFATLRSAVDYATTVQNEYPRALVTITDTVNAELVLGWWALRIADDDTIRTFATRAYEDLGSSVPEFGDYTRTAIVDTAGDALTDAGFTFDHATLRRIAGELA